VLSASYNLPVGRGKRFNPPSRVVNAIVGDWSLNGNVTFQSGPPLAFGNVIYFGGPLNLVNHPANTGDKAFDIKRFDMVSGEQPADNIRTFDSQFNNLRRDPTKNLDLSLLKTFKMGERRSLDFRFESYNLTNRVTFAAPNLSPTSTTFGLITAQANTPRRIQVGAKFKW